MWFILREHVSFNKQTFCVESGMHARRNTFVWHSSMPESWHREMCSKSIINPFHYSSLKLSVCPDPKPGIKNFSSHSFFFFFRAVPLKNGDTSMGYTIVCFWSCSELGGGLMGMDAFSGCSVSDRLCCSLYI